MMLFGKAKKAPSPKETLVKLQETINTLDKRSVFLGKKIADELAQACTLLKAKKKACMFFSSVSPLLQITSFNVVSPLTRRYLNFFYRIHRLQRR